MSSKTKKEFVVFASIGAFNTLLHTVVVVALVEFLFLNATLSNFFAFMSANVVSFFLNSRYAFYLSPSWKRYRRFFSASIFALVLTLCLSLLAEWMRWHYLVGLALVVFITPTITFMLQKYWTFKE